jgi:hypothetical protein
MAAVTCKHGTGLYEQGLPGSGDWFHSAKCKDEHCLPIPFDPGHFEFGSYIEDVGDGSFVEWFDCDHGGECDSYIRVVAGSDLCYKCGHGFEDLEDLYSPQDRVEFWRHNVCPGGGS